MGKQRKYDPDTLIAKTLSHGEETLWFDDACDPSERGGVIGHRPGNEFVTVTVMGEEWPRQLLVMLNRSVVRQMLPYLTRFAEGGDFGTPPPADEES